MPFIPSSFPIYVAIISSFHQSAKAISRTVEPPDDIYFRRASDLCNGNLPESYTWGKCAGLIDCVLGEVSAATSAGSQSAANIASLVPTAMSLVGVPPLDIVNLTLYAPHRAIAICMFGIGLPTTLFKQLQTIHDEKSGKHVDNDRERSWNMLVKQHSPENVAKRICTDVTIVGLAAIMLWHNWVVGSMIMITWRCEYSLLLFCWPMACLGWLVVAMICLAVFHESFKVTYSGDKEGQQRRWFDPFLSRYRAPQNKIQHSAAQDPTVETNEAQKMLFSLSTSNTPETTVHDYPNATDVTNIMKITICMKSNRGIRSWGFYEALLETLAVGIYLYATFVLTSSLFLTRQEAIIYASVMILCLTAIRLIGIWF